MFYSTITSQQSKCRPEMQCGQTSARCNCRLYNPTWNSVQHEVQDNMAYNVVIVSATRHTCSMVIPGHIIELVHWSMLFSVHWTPDWTAISGTVCFGIQCLITPIKVLRRYGKFQGVFPFRLEMEIYPHTCRWSSTASSHIDPVFAVYSP